ncbi:ABC transporter substrate-binding protein [Paraburkholderia caribensis]|uniref:ABC transporter substrate-binding protein n=1 Tax=Paraburkholderia caribensis TaxID=75105 RepID=A0A9Q6S6Q3_9BURK|nr:ABC transporter substrate-binding protein [Paraburkholderia caribensis]MCO4880507.1 ABC transporter substrate-binding protein [Paraburkholderia caribensis]MDR6383197.1 branched-chain amino acid transport system substrate-binding protein [Paraburkholderia caribensis]PTB24891.1 ABC transporter substrate-binding protein [Paraburkholderia caribensis]QLB65511.1 ABC transporter substrate-binding protein [Paraburkholderia caribensis]
MTSRAAWTSRIAASLAVSLTALTASAQQTIKIGEINSYKAQPAFLMPYKNGWNLALDQVNATGGVLGKKLEVVSRDDNANPGDTIRVAQELIAREQVQLLFGGYLSNTGLALTDFAKQKRMFFLAAEPLTDKIVWADGNKYTYRLRPSTYMQVAMLVPEAAKLKKKRWALVYPNYEYGQSAAATFKKLLKAAQPDVEFVTEQATPLGNLDAGSTVQALADAKPDAIFNVLFSADLGKFVREGNTRGLFKDRSVVSLLTGEPDYLDTLGAEAPVGWIVTGYPWYSIDTPANKKFVADYEAKYHDYPRLGSVVGYAALMSIANGIKKAGSTDPDKLAAAFKGLNVDTPFGPITYRPQDNQSTMGAFVGVTALKDGKGVMTSYRYIDGASVQPSDAEVKKLRPAD